MWFQYSCSFQVEMVTWESKAYLLMLVPLRQKLMIYLLRKQHCSAALFTHINPYFRTGVLDLEIHQNVRQWP